MLVETVCATHLCAECSQLTHSTRTLAKHRRVPLADKPHEKTLCLQHQVHAIEFVCLEEPCTTGPLMCCVCKEYGKHQGHKVLLFPPPAASHRIASHPGLDFIGWSAIGSVDCCTASRSCATQAAGCVGVLPILVCIDARAVLSSVCSAEDRISGPSNSRTVAEQSYFGLFNLEALRSASSVKRKTAPSSGPRMKSTIVGGKKIDIQTDRWIGHGSPSCRMLCVDYSQKSGLRKCL